MKRITVTGAIMATAVATMFLASPSFAQGGAAPTAQQGKVTCVGGNACKGQSACKTATSPAPGKNSCAHQGMTMTSTEQECKDAGGKPMKMKM